MCNKVLILFSKDKTVTTGCSIIIESKQNMHVQGCNWWINMSLTRKEIRFYIRVQRVQDQDSIKKNELSVCHKVGSVFVLCVLQCFDDLLKLLALLLLTCLHVDSNFATPHSNKFPLHFIFSDQSWTTRILFLPNIQSQIVYQKAT